MQRGVGGDVPDRGAGGVRTATRFASPCCPAARTRSAGETRSCACEAPRGLLGQLRVLRNGEDVTGALRGRDGALEGLRRRAARRRQRADGRPGTRHRAGARLRVTNHPITGPIFSGPQQTPFVCKTNQAQPPLGDSLGEPLVDNQAATASACSTPRRDGGLEPRLQRAHGRRLPLPHDGRRMEGAARGGRASGGHGHDDDARRPHGGLRRPARARHDRPLPLLLRDARAAGRRGHRHVAVERPLVYAFDGGVAIGHSQGTLGGASVDPELLGQGYAIVALQRHPHERPLQPACSAARRR